MLICYYFWLMFLSALAAGAVITSYFAAGLIMSLLVIFGMWKLFKKAGEPGWTSLIPIVNTYKLYKIGWGSGWIFLLGLIPIVNTIADIILCVKLSKAFGRGILFAVGLMVLPSIFYIILGFGDSVYVGPNS